MKSLHEFKIVFLKLNVAFVYEMEKYWSNLITCENIWVSSIFTRKMCRECLGHRHNKNWYSVKRHILCTPNLFLLSHLQCIGKYCDCKKFDLKKLILSGIQVKSWSKSCFQRYWHWWKCNNKLKLSTIYNYQHLKPVLLTSHLS